MFLVLLQGTGSFQHDLLYTRKEPFAVRILQSRHGKSDKISRNRRMMTSSIDLLYNIIFRNNSNATIIRPCKHGDSCLKLMIVFTMET
ncbi:hypothetical protein C0J52_15945 [Blattella germanica]|nr:hypothetical protein C0J52_15945 [Blattella germanica]